MRRFFSYGPRRFNPTQKVGFGDLAACLRVSVAAMYLGRSGLFVSAARTAIALLLFVLITDAALVLLRLPWTPAAAAGGWKARKLDWKVFLAASGLSLVSWASSWRRITGAVSVRQRGQWTLAHQHLL
jgi:hypothetical protein